MYDGDNDCHEYAGKNDVAQKMATLGDSDEADNAASKNGSSKKACAATARQHGDSKSKCINGRCLTAHERAVALALTRPKHGRKGVRTTEFDKMGWPRPPRVLLQKSVDEKSRPNDEHESEKKPLSQSEAK